MYQVKYQNYPYSPLFSYSNCTRISSALIVSSYWTCIWVVVKGSSVPWIHSRKRLKRFTYCTELFKLTNFYFLQYDDGTLPLFCRYYYKSTQGNWSFIPPPLWLPLLYKGYSVCSLATLVPSVLWNSLSSFMFLAEFDFPHFKTCVCTHLLLFIS